MADKNEDQTKQEEKKDEEKQEEAVDESQESQENVSQEKDTTTPSADQEQEETPAEEGVVGTEKVESGEKEEKNDIPNPSELKPGMTVRVYQKIKELNMKKEEKERIQYFEGIIIAKKHNSEKGGSITLRRVANGIGVEKIFPLNLPTITKIEIKKQAKVRRSKLYFLKKGYKKKLKEKKVS